MTKNDVMPVVPLLDGGFAVIESAARKDEYIAIYTFVRFDSEQAAEAWARDRRDDKAEESQRPRETIEAPHGGGPPFDDFWQDISTLAYMLDGELAQNRRERIAHFLVGTQRSDYLADHWLESFRRSAVIGLLHIWLNGPLERESQEYLNRTLGMALGVKTFAEVKAEMDDDEDKDGGTGKLQ